MDEPLVHLDALAQPRGDDAALDEEDPCQQAEAFAPIVARRDGEDTVAPLKPAVRLR